MRKHTISSFLCGAHTSARQHLASYAAVLCPSVGWLRRTWSSRVRGWTHCSPHLLWCPVGELVRTPDRKTQLCRNPDFVSVVRLCGRTCSSDVAVIHTASASVSSYPVVGLRCPTVLGDAWVVSPASIDVPACHVTSGASQHTHCPPPHTHTRAHSRTRAHT